MNVAAVEVDGESSSQGNGTPRIVVFVNRCWSTSQTSAAAARFKLRTDVVDGKQDMMGASSTRVYGWWRRTEDGASKGEGCRGWRPSCVCDNVKSLAKTQVAVLVSSSRRRSREKRKRVLKGEEDGRVGITRT